MATTPAKLYECANEVCSLGTLQNPGRFSDGLTPEGAAVLGLNPDNPTGEGICPNCGTKGTEVKNA